MTELVLVSARAGSLKPLLEAALANELRILEAGMRRPRDFENAYQMPTAEFLRRSENDELGETLALAEWIGEYRLLERLREKADTLGGVSFAN